MANNPTVACNPSIEKILNITTGSDTPNEIDPTKGILLFWE